MKENLSQTNCLSERLNMKGQKQVCFTVRGSGRHEWIMTVCVSDPPMQPNRTFAGDQRPIRSIVTVFFKPGERSAADSIWKLVVFLVILFVILAVLQYLFKIF